MLTKMLTRRRLKRGMCLALAVYALCLLVNLTAWRDHDGDHNNAAIHKGERLGRLALSSQHQDDSASRDRQAVDPARDEEDKGEEGRGDLLLLPEALDRALQQQPGAPAARKKLGIHQGFVQVEEAPPETFGAHRLPHENRSQFNDLIKAPQVGAAKAGVKTEPGDADSTIKKGSAPLLAHPLDRLRAINRGSNIVDFIVRQEVVPNQEEQEEEEEEEEYSEETGENKAVRLAPDGAVNVQQTNPDVLAPAQVASITELSAATPRVHATPQPQPQFQPRIQTLQSASSLPFNVSQATANFQELAHVTIYSAFYDNRYPAPLVRLLAVVPLGKLPSSASLWCVFAVQAAEPSPVSIRQTADCKRKKKYCFYMLHCQVPDDVSYRPQQANNTVLVVVGRRENHFLNQTGERVRLDVIVNRKQSQTKEAMSPSRNAPLISVCVPPLFGKLSALQLVEFIELNRLLGAQHFTFYKFRVSGEIVRVLSRYEQTGLVTVLPWNVPAPNDVWHRGDGLAMGDCLLRNTHLFDYVVFSNPDEVLVPRKQRTWGGLLMSVHALSEGLDTIAAAYEIRPVNFYTVTSDGNSPRFNKLGDHILHSEASKFLTLRSVLRSDALSADFSRLLVRPERVLELGEHHMVEPASELFVSCSVDTNVAFVHHYEQQTCSPQVGVNQSCDELHEDAIVWRYKDSLVVNTKSVLQELNRLGPSLT